MKRTLTIISGLMLSLLMSAVHAEVSVVVHPSNSASLDKDTIARIFLGKSRAFPGGAEAVPVAFKEGTAQSDEFSQSVLGKTPKQLKAYWAKMIFTGKGTPPKQMDSASQILDLVSKNPNIIGFVPAGSESGGVKVVGKF